MIAKPSGFSATDRSNIRTVQRLRPSGFNLRQFFVYSLLDSLPQAQVGDFDSPTGLGMEMNWPTAHLVAGQILCSRPTTECRYAATPIQS